MKISKKIFTWTDLTKGRILLVSSLVSNMRKKPFLGQFGAKIIPRRSRASRSYRTPDGFSFRFLFQIFFSFLPPKTTSWILCNYNFLCLEKKTAFQCRIYLWNVNCATGCLNDYLPKGDGCSSEKIAYTYRSGQPNWKCLMWKFLDFTLLPFRFYVKSL